MVGKFLLVVVLFLIKQLAFTVANENNGGNANVFLLCEVCIVKVEKTSLKTFECHHFVKVVEKSSKCESDENYRSKSYISTVGNSFNSLKKI